MDRGAWQATVHGFAKSQTPLNDQRTTVTIQTTYLSIKCKFYTDVYNGLLDSEGEGEGGMIWENGNSNMYTVM